VGDCWSGDGWPERGFDSGDVCQFRSLGMHGLRGESAVKAVIGLENDNWDGSGMSGYMTGHS
jgi:hypothetical protein